MKAQYIKDLQPWEQLEQARPVIQHLVSVMPPSTSTVTTH